LVRRRLQIGLGRRGRRRRVARPDRGVGVVEVGQRPTRRPGAVPDEGLEDAGHPAVHQQVLELAPVERGVAGGDQTSTHTFRRGQHQPGQVDRNSIEHTAAAPAGSTSNISSLRPGANASGSRGGCHAPYLLVPSTVTGDTGAP
ncbi:hypothetical protein KXW38_001664, partial [Aspergillus fumigatus]